MVAVFQTVVALLVAPNVVWRGALVPVAASAEASATISIDPAVGVETTAISTTMSMSIASSTSANTRTETVTSTVTHTMGFDCLGDQATFDAGWGSCSFYNWMMDFNHMNCLSDFDDSSHLSAAQVCPECLFCISLCLGDMSTYDAGYGTCNSYSEELGENWDFCHDDYDDATGLYAFEACPECQRCRRLSTETDTSTASNTQTLSTTAHRTATMQAMMVDVASSQDQVEKDRTRSTTAHHAAAMNAMMADVASMQDESEEEIMLVSAARQGLGATAGVWLVLLSATLTHLGRGTESAVYAGAPAVARSWRLPLSESSRPPWRGVGDS